MTEKELKFALKAAKAAKKLGIISMKLAPDGFAFEFGPQGDLDTRVRRTTSKASAKRIAEAERDAQLSLEYREIQDDLSTLHVEDPAGFERGLIENVIGDGGDEVEKERVEISGP